MAIEIFYTEIMKAQFSGGRRRMRKMSKSEKYSRSRLCFTRERDELGMTVGFWLGE